MITTGDVGRWFIGGWGEMTARVKTNLVSVTSTPRPLETDNSDSSEEPGPLQQVAHDLRQPVAAILALASAAESEADVPAPVLRRLEQISEEASWIFKVIGDLLAEASGEHGSEPVAIAPLLREVVASERLTFAGEIVIEQQDGELRHVMAVATRLRRALANVLSNATRAAGPDGRVELSVCQRGDAEIIEIADDGPGFGQVGPVHGIGLQITRQIVAECGGRMEIDRLASGRTVVRLLLPLLSCGHRAGDL
jgi:signal transduction histidine kinase